MNIDEARAVLERAAMAVGFTPPQPTQGLSEWADEVLDVALAPRGGDSWQLGHEATLSALELALVGNLDGAKIALSTAVDVVRAKARQPCTCPDPRPHALASAGRSFCSRCMCRR